jgi:hypothetical protein
MTSKAALFFTLGAALALPFAVQAQQHGDPRSELIEMIDKYDAVVRQWPGTGFAAERLQQLRQQVTTTSASQFITMDPLLEQQFTHLKDTADLLANMQDAIPMLQPQSAGFPAQIPFDVSWTATINPPGGTPTEPHPPAVRPNGQCDSTQPRTPRQRYDLLLSAVSLEAVKDIASKLCGQDFVVGNASLACLVTDIAYLVAAGINDNVSLCEGLIDAATLNAGYSRLEHVHGDLESLSTNLKQQVDQTSILVNNALKSTQLTITNAISSAESSLRTTISNTESSIKNAISTTESNLTNALKTTESKLKTDITNTTNRLTTLIDSRSDSIDNSLGDTAAALKEFRAENLRHLIEANLADAGLPIASFQLPEAHGGYLELVDTIVRETIDNKLASNQSIAQAERQYQRAKTSLNGAQFKDAYKWYSSAYKAANQ